MSKEVKCPECGSTNIEADGLIEWCPSKNDWIISSLDPEVYCHGCNSNIDMEDLIYEEITSSE